MRRSNKPHSHADEGSIPLNACQYYTNHREVLPAPVIARNEAICFSYSFFFAALQKRTKK
jgi:hypothetical protein